MLRDWSAVALEWDRSRHPSISPTGSPAPETMVGMYREAVDVSFLAWTTSLSKIFLILGTYVLGMLSGWGLVELVKRAM